ncbi:MAG: LamG domain-containing protein [Candidatus Thermoplasmatota archaeon]|nr:LamG domain-containing protein [Candidatus Thermoplasmatota archaeon]
MKNGLFRFGFIFTIFLLFIGISISPSIIGNVEQVTNPSVDYFSINSYTENFGSLAYWSFDEGSGNLAHDYSGHGFYGAINGASWTTGYSNYALDFDGEASNVNLDLYSKDLGFNKTDDYKISAWINTESTQSGVIYMMTYSSPMPIFYIKFSPDGTLQMKVQSTDICGLIINSTDSYNDGLWHYIEGRYYGNTVNPMMELYVDNELAGNDSDWLCPMSSFQFKMAKIGMGTYDSEFFNGIIDEVKVFKIPSTPPEKPKISGPASGKKETEYPYIFNADDRNNDNVKYIIDWGDGTTDTTGFYQSGINVTVKHTWISDETYNIIAYAQDEHGLNGPNTTLSVTMPKTHIYNPIIQLLLKMLDRFPFFEKILNLYNN